MRYLPLFIPYFSYCVFGGWIWRGGSSTASGWGYHVFLNDSDPTNIPDGASENRILVENGQVYIFGGMNSNSDSNNLMVLNPSTNRYLWLAGDGNSYPFPAQASRRFTYNKFNAPGGRSGFAFVLDRQSNGIFIFGGRMASLQYTNTVFRFDLGILQYSLYSGDMLYGSAGNFGKKGVSDLNYNPPALYSMCYWFDSSTRKMYIFGGSNILNQQSAVRKFQDTWVFDVISGNWTWLHGAGLTDQKGIYGNQSNFDISHIPGARHQASMAYDPLKKLAYVFGGTGVARLESGDLNDLWAYDVLKNMWAWISGASTANPVGSYGIKNFYSSQASPRARYGSILAMDPNNQIIYLVSGGSSKAGVINFSSDLWKYSIHLGLWAWVGGSSQYNSAGTFGTLGVASPNNFPPGRVNSGYYFDITNRILWVQGGTVSPSSLMNDVWSFIDDLGDPQILVEGGDSTTTSTTASTQASSSIDIVRPKPNSDPSSSAASRLPDGTVAILSGAAGLVVVISVLILLRYIRKQSYKEAIMMEMKPSANESTIEDSVISEGQSVNNLQKLSLVNYNSINTASPLIEYNFSYTEKLRHSADKTLEIDSNGFEPVVQIGSINGSPIYNGLAKANTLKERGYDKVLIKILGPNIQKLARGVEGMFWEEISTSQKLGNHKFITNYISYCIEPVALIYPSYILGSLETYLSQVGATFYVRDIFNIAFDLAKAIRLLHSEGYAHRNIKFRYIFLGRNEDKTIFATLSGFGGMQKISSDESAFRLFPTYRIDAKAAQFVPPEQFLAIKGKVIKINTAMALKAGDLFSWASVVSKLIRSLTIKKSSS